MPRIKYLFEKIYGPKYDIEFIESDRTLDDASYTKERAHEERSMAITRKWLDPITPGDDAAVLKLMNTIHPAYAPTSAPAATNGDLFPDAP